MGTFLATAARRLTEPAVRCADTGADWREPAARFASELASAAESHSSFAAPPVPVDSSDPLSFAAHAIAVLVAGRDVLLCNPRWTAAERAAAENLSLSAVGHVADVASQTSSRKDTLRATAGDNADAAQPSPVQPSALVPSAGGRRSVGAGSAPRLLVATGGSTGALRFATHTPDTLEAAALAFQSFAGGAPLNSLCLLPLHHIGGFQQLIRALATGGELLLSDWHTVAAGRRPPLPPVAGGWMLSLVPTQLQRLIDDPATSTWLRSFSTILLGGAPASAALLVRARAERLPIAISYGASEFAAALAVQPPAEFLAGETGLNPLPHATIRILDPETNIPLPSGLLGRIEVSASSLFLGYWPTQRPTGPYRTEDLGLLDTAGRLHVVGRADAAINTGGEKVHPAEVEAALCATGVFSEIVVLGMPDTHWGECIAALFPAADAPDLAAVERLLRDTLSPHKLPRRWIPVADWPRTPAGKTDRAALTRLASSHTA
jgi:O-succinylbenzoic acid--CoA ligase